MLLFNSDKHCYTHVNFLTPVSANSKVVSLPIQSLYFSIANRSNPELASPKRHLWIGVGTGFDVGAALLGALLGELEGLSVPSASVTNATVETSNKTTII